MTYKEKALEFLGIKKWHELGYKGKGIMILSQEAIATDLHSTHTDRLKDVICMSKQQGARSCHGKDVMIDILIVAPECTPISYKWGGSSNATGYNIKCAEYIKENKVHISTTSLLGGEQNKGELMALQDCIDAGCIFFGAAGNDGDTENGEKTEIKGEVRTDKYLAIGGVKPDFTGKYDENEEPIFDWNKISKTDYSSVGPELDFVTIAEICGPAGTSFCSPVIAAMCGLVQQFFIENADRRLTRDEMIQFMKDNSKDVDVEGFDNRTGFGLFILPDPETIDIKKYIPEFKGEEAMKMILKIDSNVIDVDGNKETVDYAPFINDSRAYVPIRCLEKLGLKVDWKSDTREVIIEK